MPVEIQAALIGGAVATLVPMAGGVLVFAFVWGRVRGTIRAITEDVHEIKETLKSYDLGGMRARVEMQREQITDLYSRVRDLERQEDRPRLPGHRTGGSFP